LIWIKAVGIEDGNYETIHMQPTVIVWDLETVPDLGGFAAANDLVGPRHMTVDGQVIYLVLTAPGPAISPMITILAQTLVATPTKFSQAFFVQL
jgi:hypothetical protein